MLKNRVASGYVKIGVRAGHRRWLRAAGVVAAVAVAVYVLRGRLPDPGAVLGAMRGADWRWLLVAALAEAMSLRAFARQQRRLLYAFGVSTSMREAMAVTVSRSAIAISMPAGSAVSSGFAYRRFRAWGASRQTTTTVMILSGLFSFAGLAALYATGAAAAALHRAAWLWVSYPNEAAALAVLGIVLGMTALAAALTREPSARPSAEAAPATTPRGWLSTRLAPVGEAARAAAGVPWRHWHIALGLAMVSWLGDLACLSAATHAMHLPLGLSDLAAPYLAIQLIRQIPVTPGGVGVIEASLLTALVSAGAATVPAAAAVLGYRLFSCWLILPAGLVSWLLLRRRHALIRSDDVPAPMIQTT
jgi:putative heme transporter